MRDDAIDALVAVRDELRRPVEAASHEERALSDRDDGGRLRRYCSS